MIWGKTQKVWKDYMASKNDPKLRGKVFYLGCLSSEERSWQSALHFQQNTEQMLFFNIEDPDTRYLTETQERYEIFKKEYTSLLPSREIQVKNTNLMISSGELKEIIEPYFAEIVVLDITSLPKRYFFPLIRFFLRDDRIKDLMVIYTSPGSYEITKNLADNYQDWELLPTFMDNGIFERDSHRPFYITGAGYMPMTFGNVIKAHRCRILFPFPAGLDSHFKSWDFVYTIFDGKNDDNKQHVNRHDVVPISVNDVSSAYDCIKRFVKEEEPNLPIFAPYGPKTFSLAMCLYAIKYDSPVYYTQPYAYYPEYSKGCGSSHMYALKMNGIFQF